MGRAAIELQDDVRAFGLTIGQVRPGSVSCSHADGLIGAV